MSESYCGHPRAIARNVLLQVGRLLVWTTAVIGAAVLFWLGAALLSSSAASAATPAPAQVVSAAPPSASAAKPPKPVKPRGTPANGRAGKTAATQAAPDICPTCDRSRNSRVNPTDLPRRGKYPYVPPKRYSHTNPQRAPGGGYLDKYGNTWKPAKGKHEWDVQHPTRGAKDTHTNVGPAGNVTEGRDLFPQQPQLKPQRKRALDTVQPVAPPGRSNSAVLQAPVAAAPAHPAPSPAPAPAPTQSAPAPSGPSSGDIAKAAAGTAVAGATVWWLLKLASPLCGPAVLVCAAAL